MVDLDELARHWADSQTPDIRENARVVEAMSYCLRRMPALIAELRETRERADRCRAYEAALDRFYSYTFRGPPEGGLTIPVHVWDELADAYKAARWPR